VKRTLSDLFLNRKSPVRLEGEALERKFTAILIRLIIKDYIKSLMKSPIRLPDRDDTIP